MKTIPERHDVFIDAIVSGMSNAAAYECAYPGVSRDSAKANAYKLLTRPQVREELERRLEEARTRVSNATVSRSGLLSWLVGIVEGEPDGEILTNGHRLQAAKMIADIEGMNRPVKVEVSQNPISELLEWVRNLEKPGTPDDGEWCAPSRL